MGTHISFVKSVTMDGWSPATLAQLLHSNNSSVNSSLPVSSCISPGVGPPPPSSSSSKPSGAELLIKYSSDAALLYRTKLSARAAGRPEPAEIDESIRPKPKLSLEEIRRRTGGGKAGGGGGVGGSSAGGGRIPPPFSSLASGSRTRAAVLLVLSLGVALLCAFLRPTAVVASPLLSAEVVSWRSRGEIVKLAGSGGRGMFNVDSCFSEGGKGTAKNDRQETHVVVLIHGFPSSSYDYHNVYDSLGRTLSAGAPGVNVRLIAIDHIGFGFSDKPAGDQQEYTLGRHANNLWALLNSKGLYPDDDVTKAPYIHFVSHDMGDSVLTEFVAQTYEKQGRGEGSPSRPFAGLTFTNGGMEYSLINQRLGQKLLTSRFGGLFVRLVPGRVRRLFSALQLRSIWGKDKSQMETDIADILTLNDVGGGQDLMDLLCYYLKERPVQEERWFHNLRKAALCEDGTVKPCDNPDHTNDGTRKRRSKGDDDKRQTTTTPVHLVWGDNDAVSPMSIPTFVREKRLNKGAELTVVEGGGHFWMLENPTRWVKEIARIIGEDIRTATSR